MCCCSRSGKAVRLTYEHKGADEAEAKRIVKAGGFIVLNRVNGTTPLTPPDIWWFRSGHMNMPANTWLSWRRVVPHILLLHLIIIFTRVSHLLRACR
jgi:hypothetical protein